MFPNSMYQNFMQQPTAGAAGSAAMGMQGMQNAMAGMNGSTGATAYGTAANPGMSGLTSAAQQTNMSGMQGNYQMPGMPSINPMSGMTGMAGQAVGAQGQGMTAQAMPGQSMTTPGMAGQTMPGMGSMTSGAGNNTANPAAPSADASAANYASMTNAAAAANQMAAMAGMPGMQGAPGAANPMAAGMANPLSAGMASNPALAALYQQYILRATAYQRAMGAMGTMNPMSMGMGMPGMGMTMPGMGMPPMSGMPGAPMGGMPPMGGGMGMDGTTPGGDAPFAQYKTKICNKWREGHCPFGNDCKYAHGEHELRSGGGGPMGAGPMGPGFGGPPRPAAAMGAGGTGRLLDAADKRAKIEIMKKTRICDEFMNTGMCKYGDKCTFAHGEHELRKPPSQHEIANQLNQLGGPAPVVGGPTPPKEGMFKTRLCERFMREGLCNYGDKCTFAHGTHELRAKGTTAPVTTSVPAPIVGTKRPLDNPTIGPSADAKRPNVAGKDAAPAAAAAAGAGAGAAGGEPACAHCANLLRQGKGAILKALESIENPKAKQTGAMILATAPKLDQLWHKITMNSMMEWLTKASLTKVERADLLKAVGFHVHVPEAERQNLESQKYVALGLPNEVADFVYVCMDGQEGTASMSEYFHILEVCKALYNISEEQYYTVSTALAGILMGM